jgi:hypothetical protein
MAFVTANTAHRITQIHPTILAGEEWGKTYGISAKVPASGIYRCTGCGSEITSNKGDDFPPQNDHQHPGSKADVLWELIVMTKTKA